MRRKFSLITALALALLAPASASAQLAFTTQAVNIRAGPDRQFPQVAWLPGGTTVQVVGCIQGFRWCDVVAGPVRGWVYSRFITYQFNNQPVVILNGGPMLGLPLITFSLGSYWDRHYRGRPWYANRNHWNARPLPPPPVWRPPPQRPPPGVRPMPPPRPPSNVRPPERPIARPPVTRPPPNEGRPPGTGRPPSGGNRPPGLNRPSDERPPGNQPEGGPPPRGRPAPYTQQ